MANISFRELMELSNKELVIRINDGDIIESATIQKAITLLYAEIADINSIGLSKVENDEHALELKDLEKALKYRLSLLKSIKKDLEEEEGTTVTRDYGITLLDRYEW